MSRKTSVRRLGFSRLEEEKSRNGDCDEFINVSVMADHQALHGFDNILGVPLSSVFSQLASAIAGLDPVVQCRTTIRDGS